MAILLFYGRYAKLNYKEKYMKNMTQKAMLITVLVLGLVLVLGCGTSQAKTESALKDAYDRYYNDLVLDGAQSRSVVKGETLSGISRSVYNNGFYFPVIMLASKDVVLDPDKIEPGMKLTVPDLQRNLNDPKARASIKSFLLEIAAIEDKRKRPEDAKGLRQLSNSL
jgi:hypothetical protein